MKNTNFQISTKFLNYFMELNVICILSFFA